MRLNVETSTAGGYPGWVPDAARNYLHHIEEGISIRQLARETGCHASTVLRQVRKVETLRDDPLVDAALRKLGRHHIPKSAISSDKDRPNMSNLPTEPHMAPDDKTLEREAMRILRRLCETGAVLAVAAEMDKAVVVRDTGDGTSTRTAVVDSGIAQAMALKDWIMCREPARISRYQITAAGRAELNRLIAASENSARGFAEAQAGFDGAPVSQEAEGDRRSKRMRYSLAESPLTALARRRDHDGQPFLSEKLVSAGERLREDFELAQMGPRVAQNWDRFLTAGARGGGEGADLRGYGPTAARDRVATALSDLGPGLGDVVLRCCCYLEGMESAEKRMGWSARSGKIVLRIALQRLRRHYDEVLGAGGGLIG
ncbi:DUF6456 domain-containing protein [Primorskyibacter flagellatus]|uniref:DUF6456 domain-containing protein n=1 Tax=Primorskyibacter flagellatus TaxID=1387277 RepID=A0A1W2BPT3_9RHOB|nr:DUF6456 domain-containing protein [Primorskyibacter flagellatus]SMC74947.1 hypothetical protein SAMN06295998_104240 [Primorskyibacter flagellatus]